MIEGVEIYYLKSIPDSRGRILHFMRKNSSMFEDFDIQEVYFSVIYPGAIKAWHRHKRMTLNYVVPIGNIKLVLYDGRADSKTAYDVQEIYLGENCPHQLVRIPPLIWNGYTTVDGKLSLVANITDFTHDPDEIERKDPNNFVSDDSIPYEWFTSNYG